MGAERMQFLKKLVHNLKICKLLFNIAYAIFAILTVVSALYHNWWFTMFFLIITCHYSIKGDVCEIAIKCGEGDQKACKTNKGGVRRKVVE